MERFFFQKELPKMLFMGEILEKIYVEGVYGGTNDQVIGTARSIFPTMLGYSLED